MELDLIYLYVKPVETEERFDEIYHSKTHKNNFFRFINYSWVRNTQYKLMNIQQFTYIVLKCIYMYSLAVFSVENLLSDVI